MADQNYKKWMGLSENIIILPHASKESPATAENDQGEKPKPAKTDEGDWRATSDSSRRRL